MCGSVTTWTGNPSFCVFEVDKKTLLPVKRITYAFDMEGANRNGTIEWTSYTEYTKDYGLTDFSPKALKAFGDSLLTDINAASNF